MCEPRRNTKYTRNSNIQDTKDLWAYARTQGRCFSTVSETSQTDQVGRIPRPGVDRRGSCSILVGARHGHRIVRGRLEISGKPYISVSVQYDIRGNRNIKRVIE